MEGEAPLKFIASEEEDEVVYFLIGDFFIRISKINSDIRKISYFSNVIDSEYANIKQLVESAIPDYLVLRRDLYTIEHDTTSWYYCEEHTYTLVDTRTEDEIIIFSCDK